MTKPKADEPVFLTIGSSSVSGSVMGPVASKHLRLKISLNLPVCAEIGDKVSISRKFNDRWRYVTSSPLHSPSPLTIVNFLLFYSFSSFFYL